MATVIRMKRGGRTHAPYYRVVVTDSHRRAFGREIEQIGIYQPCARPEPRIEIDREKALYWLERGASLSQTARSILSKQGILAAFAGQRRKPGESAKSVQGEAVSNDTSHETESNQHREGEA